jgi:hypothetical protein
VQRNLSYCRKTYSVKLLKADSDCMEGTVVTTCPIGRDSVDLALEHQFCLGIQA